MNIHDKKKTKKNQRRSDIRHKTLQNSVLICNGKVLMVIVQSVGSYEQGVTVFI